MRFNQIWFTQDDREQNRECMIIAGYAEPYEGPAILETMDAFSDQYLNPAGAARLGKYLVELNNLNLERGLIPRPRVPENSYDPKESRVRWT